eukprot:TRINITY_DN9935_c0_g1_i2.p1 TRINITY_DN9935_c0_g1~~TRINITY_DN9935_c0_g1_i2.p1  ORF type:complete len:270 (-),score=21.94 TRINITY_DN9935_c0_g1_i2:462-1271(-)
MMELACDTSADGVDDRWSGDGPLRAPARRFHKRNAAKRRAQRLRAQTRSVNHLLGGFRSVVQHRGGRVSHMGQALFSALRMPGRAALAPTGPVVVSLARLIALHGVPPVLAHYGSQVFTTDGGTQIAGPAVALAGAQTAATLFTHTAFLTLPKPPSTTASVSSAASKGRGAAPSTGPGGFGSGSQALAPQTSPASFGGLGGCGSGTSAPQTLPASFGGPGGFGSGTSTLRRRQRHSVDLAGSARGDGLDSVSVSLWVAGFHYMRISIRG